jgi:hypothetical protein
VKFHLKADIAFDADDLFDAFEALANHFDALTAGILSQLEFTGDINLEPQKEA